MRYFIDTSFLVGISNKKDKYHKNANNLLDSFQNKSNTKLFISDYVIDEFLSILIKGSSIKDAIEWGKLIYSEQLAHIVYCTQKINKIAWNILQLENQERNPMNLTDCVVYVKSKMLKCDEILTFDARLKNFDMPI